MLAEHSENQHVRRNGLLRGLAFRALVEVLPDNGDLGALGGPNREPGLVIEELKRRIAERSYGQASEKGEYAISPLLIEIAVSLIMALVKWWLENKSSHTLALAAVKQEAGQF